MVEQMELFQKTKRITKKQQLLDFIKDKKVAKTSEVIRFGLDNYFNRALRTAQELVAEGHIRRLTKEQKKFRFGIIREDVFIWEE